MRMPRLKVTSRSLVVVVSLAVCAVLIWLFPFCYQAAWAWVIVRDVSRGQSMKYGAKGWRRAARAWCAAPSEPDERPGQAPYRCHPIARRDRAYGEGCGT